MRCGSFNIYKKRTSQCIVVFAILLVLLGSGCRSVSPKLQDEYLRPGLSHGMCRVFEKYRRHFPKKMAEDKVPGVSCAIVDRDGILWAAGFGYADYDRKTPVTTDTTFLICSVSKTITATAVMLAVQEGLLELDVPIIEYLPQFTVHSRFEEHPEKKITLRHLLSHTSGIAFEAPVGNGREPSYGTLEEHVLSVSDTWLRHKVGERYSYSGPGYDLAAYILQVQSGQPFARNVEDKVFAPLGMTNCSVDPEFIRNHPDRAVGHMPYARQLPLASDIPWMGAGSVYANAKGMARFVQLFLNWGRVAGQAVLDESLIKSMYVPSIRSRQYGLGLDIYPNNEHLIFGHGGAGIGFGSIMIWYPEYGIGGIFLFNRDQYAWGSGCTDIFSDLMHEGLIQKNEFFEIPSGEYQAWQPPDPNTVTPFKPAWQKYVGTYKYLMSGWKFSASARLALALGLTTKSFHVKVYEKDGYLYVDSLVFHDDDGGRLDEYLPGLFFTPTGKCLDLRGPKLTWQNYRIKKVDNDSDGKFDLN